jgi:hypothetical protein
LKFWNMEIHLPLLLNGSDTVASHSNGLWSTLTTKEAWYKYYQKCIIPHIRT